MKLPKKFGLILRVLISIGLVTFAYYFVDRRQLVEAIADVPYRFVFLAATLYALTLTINITKWYVLLRGAGIDVPLLSVLRASFAGLYINCFGFGTVGGDVTKALWIARQTKDREVALVTVVADRALGLLLLGILGVFGALVTPHNKVPPALLYGTIAGVVLLSAGWLFAPFVIQRSLARLPKIRDIFGRIARGFPRDRARMLQAVIIGLVFHLAQISLFCLVTWELSSPIPFRTLLASLPFANIVTTLPLSWMGLGVREGVYVYFFVPEYLTQGQAIVAAALWLMSMTITSVIGGLIVVLDRRKPNASAEAPAPFTESASLELNEQ